MPKNTDGFLVVNKPPGITSHDVVLHLRKTLGISKIGHSGTLDAPACGVLVLGVGKATRLLQFITALPKKYSTDVILGKSTDTGDDTGKIVDTIQMPLVKLSDLTTVAQKFIGEIEQIPPMHSAKKVAGKRLYELAYQGKEIERKSQKVSIYKLDIEWKDEAKQIARLEVECSMGTYIRTLGSDIAEALGGVGHIKNLCRSAIGSFLIEDAVVLETDKTLLLSKIIPLAKGMSDYAKCILDNPTDVKALQNGRAIPISTNNFSLNISLPTYKSTQLNPTICGVSKENKELIAVCEIFENELRPKVVIPS